MNITYALTLPTEVASVPTARAICRANLELLRVNGESVDDVTLALTEACANVVKHAGGHRYQVRVSVDAERCVIEVIDEGDGFDPDAPRVEDAAELLPSGRGLLLMESVVDRLHFTRRDDTPGTVVSLEKRLVLEADSPLASSSLT